ncbi:unnamed protein product [Effrenium voratum]|uniref:Uncharacterized protein n=1 Tax=Effrenium voratum TaxID=2562239 RepID=A0AA36JES1_9DINO|nr:unnamed protein product [Effrenium voratum]
MPAIAEPDAAEVGPDNLVNLGPLRRKPGLHISEADIVLQEIQLASATQALPHGCCTD